MKTLRAELTAEGRLDILDKVMAYRGGILYNLYELQIDPYTP